MSRKKKREKKGPSPNKERNEDLSWTRLLILGLVLLLFVAAVLTVVLTQ